MCREDEFDHVRQRPPTDKVPVHAMSTVLPFNQSDNVNDARLPLIIGIAADHALTAQAARMAEEPVAKILGDMRSLYRATPFLLLVQLPAPLRGFADRLADKFDADVVDLEDHRVFALGQPDGGYSTNLASDPCEDTTCKAAFLADHSHLVIVFSYSPEMAPRNLVAQIIQFRLQGIPNRHTGRPLQLDKIGLGSVHHVIAGHTGGAAANAPISIYFCPQIETRSGNKELDDATAWDHLDRFNGDVVSQLRRRARAPHAPHAQPCASPLGHSWVGNRFAVADALANHFQQATHTTMFVLLVLGLIAALAFQLSGVLSHATLVYTASLVLAYGWYLWAYWRRYEHRFYDYRALAEGLRVQMYWNAAGITACAADYYLRRQRSEFEWVRQALRAWTLIARMPEAASSSSDVDRHGRFRQVFEQWVEDEWDYYSRTALRRQSTGTWLNRVGMGFFVLGLLLAGAKPLFNGSVAFTVAIGLAPAAAALLYMYAQTRAFLEQARQYDRMCQLFGSARRRLPQVLEEGDAGVFQHMLLELGKEALRENGDWVLLHRERPITFGSARSWILAGSWILGVCSCLRRKEKPLHSQ